MSRPRRTTEPASLTVAFRVSPAEKRALAQVAAEQQARLATVVRDAVNAYVADYRDDDPVFRPAAPRRPR